MKKKIPDNKVIKDNKLYIRGRREKLYAAKPAIINDEKVLFIENKDKELYKYKPRKLSRD